MSGKTEEENSIQTRILVKFIGFSIALFALPLLTYYWTLKHWFSGYNTLYAGIAAVVVVNVVLAFYIAVAFLEKDDTSPKPAKKQQ
ncbi:vacuolar H-ATPase assembly protein Vma21 [Schizosaccharomyces cryophilus OY26]|uniref:Vacuolar H-ATPase assembly protein Vma21 n=1 Tax=Schizosaccharomyces cryophilus (strain OY26 / ATCC MYA-4695 / CBS 11777 / NBRC 106824 / NRRL Y48691) TaxID=653667 RepID=S9X8A4_SCHCR|nr:vacuolar H-ATPase assembly protein Vma21 [Schizosaccharomyces cryophilus OY26]EPY50056.1 vacuolar H-ATPase assembly protein Vma21 [Schizosaccharomyces cryophilus OY26]